MVYRKDLIMSYRVYAQLLNHGSRVHFHVFKGSTKISDRYFFVKEFEDDEPNPYISETNGVYNYKWVDGKPVERTEDEKHPPIPLDYAKGLKMIEVDSAVQSKISAGLSFDGHTFSLSQNAQINWTNLRANKDLLTFPVECSIQDSPYIYYIEEENIDALVGAVLNAVKTILEHARAAKLGIQALTTIEAVEAYQIVI